jgi:cytochrome c peroxidase
MKRSIAVALFVLAVMTVSAPAAEINEAFLALYKPPLPKRIENPDKPASPAQIDLGRMLFYDTRFSIGQNISCNSCHDLANFGVDGKRVSLGHKDQPGTRNSPTVYNSAGHFAQFWDGRAATVEEQAMMPVLNPVEMAMPNKEYVIQVLKSIPGYVEAFGKAFPGEDDPVTFENFGRAIGAFERGLVTPAPWDKFLAGDKSAISDEAKKGFTAFTQKGCMTCHMGTYVGGTFFQKLGVVQPWPSQKDQGRYEHTKNEADRMFFKAASLRNVAKTAPYFHDGSVESLEEAVRIMSKYQAPIPLTDDDVKHIVAFLESLTGEIPHEYIKKPELPPSGPNTPKPKLD